MYFVEELHSEKEVVARSGLKFDKKELDLAKKLIETLAASFEPEKYQDEYKRNVEDLIEKKRKGLKVTPIRQPKQTPVIDLMQALQQSLAKNATRKAATKKTAAAKKTVRKRGREVA